MSRVQTVSVSGLDAAREKKQVSMEKPYGLYPLVWVLAQVAAGAAWLKEGVCWLLGIKKATNSALFDGLGVQCRAVKEGAKGWRALHALYSFPTAKYESSVIGRLVDKLWLTGLRNPRGVRNRLRIVVDSISGELRRVIDQKGSATILSLACGSAEAVFHAVDTLGFDKHKVQIHLLDQDETALAYAENEAKKLGLEVHATKASVARLKRVFANKKADVIEMVGLLDYLDDGTAIRLFEAIQDCLTPGGMFVTANVMPNTEIPFLRYCSDWEMIYRQPEQLAKICSFVFNSHSEVEVEPMQIHAIATCRK